MMFARWFTSLDQSLEAMVGRYAVAKTIRHDVPRFRSHDARMLFLAKESAKGFLFKDLSEEIRSDGHAELKKPHAIIEFAWLMFFLKDWRRLAAAIRETAPRHPFPGHMADLYFLAAYRLDWETLAQGVDRDGFEDRVSQAIAFIRKHWPAESSRVELFLALLQNSLGERQAARDRIIRFAPELDLIPPLAAAKATLPKPARDTTAWPLEIRGASGKRATLLSIDQTYYKRYAAPFLAIHRATNPDRCVHFHCVGFDPRTLDGVVDIDETIGFTIDRTDITGLGPRDRQGYYACARLMHAIAYLGIYDDILISDADGSVDLSASEVLEERAEADVVIKSKILRPGHAVFNLPWATIPAAANIVRQTAGGRLFTQYLRDYLAEIFVSAHRKERPMWFADQCALFYAYADLKDQVSFGNCDKVLYNQGRNWALFSGETAKKKYIEKALQKRNLAG
jgi:hypothetical protein